ncbi:MAG: cytochrome c-type biogenesis protein CcmH [Paracoccus sp. (in: a-proteobacteria)]|uniref:cytochrome c-type biogenesis protein n=1 Tax=Paracoccus sp. TaxID=267 RepID=UPI0026DEE94D|nr:cytochrome c-type biogenesis protein [Paracoccus sp. (in: a-proteobacteria)]MDO5630479.1 cytochrome c-type biogenesis protein CcmH [Paracoccus sp. (in: a-proteobacteria)]
MKRLVLIALLAFAPVTVAVAPMPAVAVQPDEVLDDPVLETRARAISQKLRCPVCQGENIDDSNAAISRDLRLYVRERLVAGDSDNQVIDAVTARYGEFVLFEPRATGANWVLWLAGPVMGLVALAFAAGFLRRRQGGAGPAPLTDEEKARLDRLMQD